MGQTELLEYCRVSSARKFDSASSLYRSRKYADCLFFCHLALEFALKGKYIEVKHDLFPLTHDLLGLGLRIGLPLTKQRQKDLAIINTFNIAARYDDYKYTFYKKATRVYARKYYQTTRALLIWLKEYTTREK